MPPDTIERALPALKDPSLFRTQCFIGGHWTGADDGGTRTVTNPATGVAIGTVPVCGATETRRAIEAAGRAFPAWRDMLAKDRCAIVRKWYDLILQHADDLALILTTEQGKPLAEAKAEIAIGAAYVEWFAEEGKRIYGDVIPTIG
ncbi:MAG: aldehyde dehydrogenase family protein, partial [Casimicrobiaceae bacterium]